MSTLDTIENISSKFQGAVGSGKGIVAPDYDIENVAIVLQSDDRSVLVHQKVGNLAERAWGATFGEGVGTGEFTNDAVVRYSKEEFAEKFEDGDFVTLEQYQADKRGMETGIVVNDKVVLVNDLTVMKDRLVEVGRDMEAYQEANAARLNDDIAMDKFGVN